jgi:fructose-bisphosphate aldolase class I
MLEEIIKKLLVDNKGLLAADESLPTIAKRFKTVGLESTEDMRRAYREMLFTTPNIEQYISGVILFEETLHQKTQDNVLFPEYLANRNIIPGIKIDQGLEPFGTSEKEKITQGLDGLAERLEEYKNLGAKFTKFRSAFTISETTPTQENIMANADILAQMAKESQEKGLLPIVEPEVLLDGRHPIEKCATVTTQVLKEVFTSLEKFAVDITKIFIKTNMALPGKEAPKESPEKVAKATIEALRNSVPKEVPAIVFLSGGQSPDEASRNLNAIAKTGQQPWQLSFSFARALQEEALNIWQGNQEKVLFAQNAFIRRAKMVTMAVAGQYQNE